MSQHYHNTGQPFKEFEPSSKKEWIDRMKLEVPGKKTDHILSGKIREGLAILPIYSKEDIAALPLAASQLKSKRTWEYHESIFLHEHPGPTAWHTQILQALHAGVAGIDFHFPDPGAAAGPHWQELLAGTEIPHYKHSFYLKSEQLALFDAFLHYMTGLGVATQLRGSLFLLPDFSKPLTMDHWHQQIAIYFSKKSCPSYRLLGMSSRPFEEAGASVVQSLAYTLSWIVYHLDKLTDLGVEVGQLCSSMEVELTTQSNYLIDIAKFRAMRVLLCQLTDAYGVKDIRLADWHIKASSGGWNKTVYGAFSNLLRNTTEAMGAIIGGCDALTVLPHDVAFTRSGSFGNRIARNVATILEHEAHMDKVDDPAAGSYFLESMTWQIITQVWQEFLSIEQLGGFGEAMKTGIIPQRMKDYRLSREGEIKTRRRPFVGATRYVDAEDTIQRENLRDPSMMDLEARGASFFENLRLKVDQYVAGGNPRPAVGLLERYEVQEAGIVNARIAFIRDLMACVGVSVDQYIFSGNSVPPETNIENEVLILCGSNSYYENDLLIWLKDNEMVKHKTLWLAGQPRESREAMLSSGVHDFIVAGADVWQVLCEILNKLGIAL